MKTPLALLALAALVLAPAPALSDQAGARGKLEKDGLAFTPEAFLQTVAAGDASHAALFVEAGIDPSVKSGTPSSASTSRAWLKRPRSRRCARCSKPPSRHQT